MRCSSRCVSNLDRVIVVIGITVDRLALAVAIAVASCIVDRGSSRQLRSGCAMRGKGDSTRPEKLEECEKGKGLGSMLSKGLCKGRQRPEPSPSRSPSGSHSPSPRCGPAQPPIVNVGAAEVQEDVEWDQASSASARSSSRAMSALMLLPVLMVHLSVRIRDCKLCGESCCSESPLVTSAPDDRYGGYRPWQQYCLGKLLGFKVAKGDICNICWAVYKELGGLD